MTFTIICSCRQTTQSPLVIDRNHTAERVNSLVLTVDGSTFYEQRLIAMRMSISKNTRHFMWHVITLHALTSTMMKPNHQWSYNGRIIIHVLHYFLVQLISKRGPSRNPLWTRYSISQEICTRFCCALLCCGYAIVHNDFTWSIYPYSSGLLCWHWGNR